MFQERIVGFGSLRVRVGRDGSYWYARGLELDYEALGDTPAQARRHFTDGLAATACEHRRVHGHLEHLLAPAPPEVWREFLREAHLLSRIGNDPVPAEVNPPFTGTPGGSPGTATPTQKAMPRDRGPRPERRRSGPD